MIVPGGFEGAKGSFGECTGINLDVGSSVRSFRGRGGEGEESIGSRSIASVRFARLCNDRRTNRDRHPVFPQRKCKSFRSRQPCNAFVEPCDEDGKGGRINAPECDRRVLDIEAKESEKERKRKREHAESNFIATIRILCLRSFHSGRISLNAFRNLERTHSPSSFNSPLGRGPFSSPPR